MKTKKLVFLIIAIMSLVLLLSATKVNAETDVSNKTWVFGITNTLDIATTLDTDPNVFGEDGLGEPAITKEDFKKIEVKQLVRGNTYIVWDGNTANKIANCTLSVNGVEFGTLEQTNTKLWGNFQGDGDICAYILKLNKDAILPTEANNGYYYIDTSIQNWTLLLPSDVTLINEDKDKNYNEADKNYVENLIKKFQDTTPPYWIYMDLYLYDDQGMSIEDALTKKFNDASITLEPDGRVAGDIDFLEKGFWVCKNNVRYQQIQVHADIYRVRKDVKVDNNISISGLLPDVNVKVEQKENNEMVTEVNNVGYTKVLGTYELTLTGATSLANPIDITFELGTEYNGQVAYILHKKANGSYERFEEQIKDGKVTITVSELSPFVVAVKENSQTTTPSQTEQDKTPTTNKGEKDTTPKTGIIDIIGYVLVTTILSGIGIVALKKKI